MAEIKTPGGLVVGLILDPPSSPPEPVPEKPVEVVDKPRRGRRPKGE